MLDEITLPDGTTRRLGNRIPVKGLEHQWPVFGEVPNTRVFPRADWDKLLANYEDLGPDHPFLPPLHDQNGVGQCNADASTLIGEFCRGVQGLEYIALSAADLYEQINGGADNGSLLEDGIRAMMATGVGTAAKCGTLWKRGQYTPATGPERAKNRVLEAFLCPTFDHCFSATIQGFGLISGVPWYGNYNPMDNGLLPAGRGSSGGHAIGGYKPTKLSGRFAIWHQNSWGKWGPLNGRFAMAEEHYTDMIGGWWAVRSMTDEGR